MPRLSVMEGARVRDARGRDVGRVEHVLFHPSDPRPVGVEVTRPRLLYVVARPPVFLPLGAVRVEEGVLTLQGTVPTRRASEKEMGHSWDETVIWMGMPARSSEGKKLGIVRDADVSIKGATLKSLLLTEGAVTDAALGSRTVPPALVRGFDGQAVVIEEAALEAPAEGGLAGVAGKGAAHAKVGAEQLAAKAVSASVAAVRAARRTETGRRAGKLLGSLKRSVLDAMREDDEE